MSSRLWRVYVLLCPETRAVRYVGITSSPLVTRLRYHISDHSNQQKAQWIADLQKRGLVPIIREVSTIRGPRRLAENIERLCIWGYLLQGCDLLNIQHIPENKPAFLAALRASDYANICLNQVTDASTSA